MVETSDAWITERTGIRSRHIAPDGVVTSDMATAAAKNALDMAGLKPTDLDMIVVGTVTPDMPMPATAVFVQQKLGAGVCPAFDLSAACAGFVFGLTIADQFIALGADEARAGHRRGAPVARHRLDRPHHLHPLRRRRGRGGARPQPTPSPAIPSRAASSPRRSSPTARWPTRCASPAAAACTPTSHETVEQKLQYVHMKGQDIFKVAVKNLIQRQQERPRARRHDPGRHRLDVRPPGQPAHHRPGRRSGVDVSRREGAHEHRARRQHVERLHPHPARREPPRPARSRTATRSSCAPSARASRGGARSSVSDRSVPRAGAGPRTARRPFAVRAHLAATRADVARAALAARAAHRDRGLRAGAALAGGPGHRLGPHGHRPAARQRPVARRPAQGPDGHPGPGRRAPARGPRARGRGGRRPRLPRPSLHRGPHAGHRARPRRRRGRGAGPLAGGGRGRVALGTRLVAGVASSVDVAAVRGPRGPRSGRAVADHGPPAPCRARRGPGVARHGAGPAPRALRRGHRGDSRRWPSRRPRPPCGTTTRSCGPLPASARVAPCPTRRPDASWRPASRARTRGRSRWRSGGASWRRSWSGTRGREPDGRPRPVVVQPTLHAAQPRPVRAQTTLPLGQPRPALGQTTLHAGRSRPALVQPTLHAVQPRRVLLQTTLHALQPRRVLLQATLHALQPRPSVVRTTLRVVQPGLRAPRAGVSFAGNYAYRLPFPEKRTDGARSL